MNEKWKTIYLYPSYMISNYGRVKNKCTGKSLKPVKMKNGYLTVNLYDKNGKRESSHKDISVTPPAGLFERIIDINVGKSMVDRLQKGGQKMVNSEVTDKLMLTY